MASPSRLRPQLARRYSGSLDYSPRVEQQPAVPETPPTAIYHEFAAAMPDQTGKLAVVTGGNAGLGYWAARTLATKGARVIIACRSVEKGDAARRRIEQLDLTRACDEELEKGDASALGSAAAMYS